MRRYTHRWLALAAVAALACDDAPTDVDDAQDPGPNARVAAVAWAGDRPALYAQGVDGGRRARLHLRDVEDRVEGQSPYVPGVSDSTVNALGSVRWSPDGAWVAVAVTMFAEQSEIVVVDSAGRRAFVASPNGQAVMSNVAWSPDGRRLAYAMSTRPRGGAVEIFVSDVTDALARAGGVPVVRRVTNGLTPAPLSVRFDATGAGLWITRRAGEGGAPLFESITRVDHVNATTGAVTTHAAAVPGEVEGVSAAGDWALSIRRVAVAAGGGFLERLTRVPLAPGGAEVTLAPPQRIAYARLTAGRAGDERALLAVDPSASGGTALEFSHLRTRGSAESRPARVGAGVTSADLWMPPGDR